MYFENSSPDIIYIIIMYNIDLNHELGNCPWQQTRPQVYHIVKRFLLQSSTTREESKHCLFPLYSPTGGCDGQNKICSEAFAGVKMEA